MATLTAGQGSRATGTVSGFVLKLARQSTALTQERLAELLRVDVTTIQGWESGRRPLAAMNAGDFMHLCSRLSRLGASPSTGRVLREAIEADQILSVGITAGANWIDANIHPLAANVYRKTTTNLITWPITRTTPAHLADFTPRVPRRGPATTYPSLSADEQTRFLDHLRTVAERSAYADEPLLRRQAVYLLGFDNRPQIVEWLRTEWNHARRRPLAHYDITQLLEARSASVALASAGDETHIHDFVEQHMGNSRAEVVNLNYWAHWIGELNDEHTSDEFLLSDDSRTWTGTRLLNHLTNRLTPDAPHLPLNLHTLHALVAWRPFLLNERPAVQATLAEVLDRLASADNLTRAGRDKLSGLHYALRIADR